MEHLLLNFQPSKTSNGFFPILNTSEISLKMYQSLRRDSLNLIQDQLDKNRSFKILNFFILAETCRSGLLTVSKISKKANPLNIKLVVLLAD